MEVRSKVFGRGPPLIGFIDHSSSEIKARSCSAFARAKVAQCAAPVPLYPRMPVRPCLLHLRGACASHSTASGTRAPARRVRRALAWRPTGRPTPGRRHVRWYPSTVLCLVPKATELLRSSEMTRRVKSAVLTVGQSLPVYRDNQTLSVSADTSQKCQNRKYDHCSRATNASRRLPGECRTTISRFVLKKFSATMERVARMRQDITMVQRRKERQKVSILPSTRHCQIAGIPKNPSQKHRLCN
jgi:hypothetical protein